MMMCMATTGRRRLRRGEPLTVDVVADRLALGWRRYLVPLGRAPEVGERDDRPTRTPVNVGKLTNLEWARPIVQGESRTAMFAEDFPARLDAALRHAPAVRESLDEVAALGLLSLVSLAVAEAKQAIRRERSNARLCDPERGSRAVTTRTDQAEDRLAAGST